MPRTTDLSDDIAVFFYGTFMHPEVLAAQQVRARAVTPASVAGFRLTIGPRVNLARVSSGIVYGSIAEVEHPDLARLYAGLQADYGLTYLPEAVLATMRDGISRPALCYIARAMSPKPPDPDYVRELAACVRRLGHPESYAQHVESFLPVG